MGLTYTEITLMNPWDVENAEHGLINQSDVRQTTVQALVDSGATDLVINETIRRKLGLRIVSDGTVLQADDTPVECQETGPVDVYWKDRGCSCRAVVMPGHGEVLLGAFPMESLDLAVNPFLQEVTGAHGNKKRHIAKGGSLSWRNKN